MPKKAMLLLALFCAVVLTNAQQYFTGLVNYRYSNTDKNNPSTGSIQATFGLYGIKIVPLNLSENGKPINAAVIYNWRTGMMYSINHDTKEIATTRIKTAVNGLVTDSTIKNEVFFKDVPSTTTYYITRKDFYYSLKAAYADNLELEVPDSLRFNNDMLFFANKNVLLNGELKLLLGEGNQDTVVIKMTAQDITPFMVDDSVFALPENYQVIDEAAQKRRMDSIFEEQKRQTDSIFNSFKKADSALAGLKNTLEDRKKGAKQKDSLRVILKKISKQTNRKTVPAKKQQPGKAKTAAQKPKTY